MGDHDQQQVRVGRREQQPPKDGTITAYQDPTEGMIRDGRVMLAEDPTKRFTKKVTRMAILSPVIRRTSHTT